MKASKDAIRMAQYDRLYRLADAIILKQNPCKIEKGGSCLRGRTLKKMDKRGDEYATGKDGFSFCCGSHRARGDYGPEMHQNCPGLIKDRCMLRSLPCRLWLCDWAIEESFETFEILNRIRRMARSRFRMGTRFSRVECLGGVL